MSRIGRLPIAIPAGVDVTIDGSTVTVKGPKGTLTRTVHSNISVAKEGETVVVSRPNDDKMNRSLHGLSRTLIANMVQGCNVGYSKELDIVGIGYRVQVAGNELSMNLGFSHPVVMQIPEGINVEVLVPVSPAKIRISGPDKQKVGQFAANVREKRPPEPYKGKGIKYAGEYIRRKEGKAGKA